MNIWNLEIDSLHSPLDELRKEANKEPINPTFETIKSELAKLTPVKEIESLMEQVTNSSGNKVHSFSFKGRCTRKKPRRWICKIND